MLNSYRNAQEVFDKQAPACEVDIDEWDALRIHSDIPDYIIFAEANRPSYRPRWQNDIAANLLYSLLDGAEICFDDDDKGEVRYITKDAMREAFDSDIDVLPALHNLIDTDPLAIKSFRDDWEKKWAIEYIWTCLNDYNTAPEINYPDFKHAA